MHSIITGKTNICGLMGNPIEHSLSPQIHNTAFSKLHLDFVYVPFRVQKKDLKAAISGIRVMGIKGFNVTMPHKIDVLQYLDELDPLAAQIGAVNTVVNTDGILKGFNTDALGYLMSLEEHGINPQGKRIIILGSGGAARAISFILMQKGAILTIINRTVSKAQNMSHDLSRVFGQKPEVFELHKDTFIKAFKSADILVNTTNIGMSPNIEGTPVDGSLLQPNLIVSDIVYIPVKTRLLSDAEAAGAMTISGVDMVICQAALAFEKWTGVKSPVSIMREEMYRILKS